jgi:2-keto-4-pentenoate hydratase/2-oxohepta-3-ene-1,7-dioic acid hydratase in catechol pathway
MRFVTYLDGNRTRLGLSLPGGLADVASLGDWAPKSVDELLRGGNSLLEQISDAAPSARHRDQASVRIGPCVPNPGKIICIGRNYAGHAAETGNPLPGTPLLFSKFSNSLAGSGEVILLPRNSTQLDYEAELAVVIGRRARDVPERSALDFVFGYCNANDLSARDLQFRTSQWLLGKSWDHALPLGPWLVSADEVDDPQRLDIRCWVNGELRQHDNTASMVFGVEYLISYISHHMTLEPGDIVSTGTPEGVIMGSKSKIWLKPGDEVAVEIEHLGHLANTLA